MDGGVGVTIGRAVGSMRPTGTYTTCETLVPSALISLLRYRCTDYPDQLQICRETNIRFLEKHFVQKLSFVYRRLASTRSLLGSKIWCLKYQFKMESMEKGVVHKETAAKPDQGKYTLIRSNSDEYLVEPYLYGGLYDEPLPCFGCGVGWFTFLLGFVFPPLWYYAAFLYLRKYSRKNPRERPGLGASAIAALVCTVAAVILTLSLVL